MKLFTWLALTALFFLGQALPLQAAEPEASNHYRVTRSNYAFSTVFEMATNHQLIGTVSKSVFHLVRQYDSYDHLGTYEGTGISSILCLGFLYVRGTEIVIKDAFGNYEGMIDGQFASTEPAKFSFYDKENRRFAIAYMDQNRMGFSIVDPDNTSLILARLTRNFIMDAIDNWEVAIYHPDRLPRHHVKTFASFVCDRQNDFKADL